MKTNFYDYKKDGITQGLFLTWMNCRQKARWFLDGWSSKYGNKEALTYGTIIHGILESVYDQIRLNKIKDIPSAQDIKNLTKIVEKKWLKENPKANKYALEDLDMSLLIAESTLPAYFRFYWKKDIKELKWRKLEQEFSIPYVTKDGRKTFIRGKKDGVYGEKSIRLFETKTKSMISVDNLIDTLWFEMQINLYLWAIEKTYKQIPSGVTYNIIRKTSLRMSSGESKVQYAKRVADDINKRPSFYFIRLNVSITKQDMDKFKEELEYLVTEFMDWCDGKTGTYKNTSQCMGKYGNCSFLGLCSKKDFGMYEKRKVVFRELDDY